jgi:EXLDI family protein
MTVPNKTIYVSEEDLPVFQKAQELAGGNLSAAISTALRRFIEVEEGQSEGYEEIVVRVGPKRGRKVRFTGVLLGEWSRSTSQGVVEQYRIYRSHTGKFAVHKTRSAEWTAGSPDDKWNKGWRSWVGNWSSEQSWGFRPEEATLRVAETLEELKEMLPTELYDMVVDAAEQPAIEDLDI